MWISETEAKQAGLVDNDWVEVFNVNGTLTARVVVSQRVPAGMCLMYHAQEKIVNVPGAETSGKRGGIHNSVTRTVLKPTHMIGGYAQQAYGLSLIHICGVRARPDHPRQEAPQVQAERQRPGAGRGVQQAERGAGRQQGGQAQQRRQDHQGVAQHRCV